MNTFSDFHSRDGAPDDEPFYTLQAHAERILQKEQALDRRADGKQVARRSSAAQSPINNITTKTNTIGASVDDGEPDHGDVTDGSSRDGPTKDPTPDNSVLKESASAAKASSGADTHTGSAETSDSKCDNTDRRGDMGMIPKRVQTHTTHTSSDDATPCGGEKTHVVCQHLLITEPMPVPTDKLQKHEHNLAGKSLLPHLAPND